MKYVCAFFISAMITSCVHDAKESVQDGDFTIEFLFQKDSCRMYRFKDGGRYIYWADCRGNVQYSYTTSTGKTTTTHKIESSTSK